MMTSILVAAVLLMASCGSSSGQKVGTSPSITQHEIFLNGSTQRGKGELLIGVIIDPKATPSND